MNFENLQYSNYGRTGTFRISPIHVAYANTLRRLIMTGVETVAFRADMTTQGTTTDVKVHVNDTPMTNEMLAHRIGLLPIHVKEPLKWSSVADKYTFTLKVAAYPDSIRDVTCSDFVITEEIGEGREPLIVPTENFFPPHPKTRDTCLISTLAPGNGKIEIVAKATLGSGRENARFQPTSQCSYVYTRDEDPEKVDAYFARWLMDAKKVDIQSLEKDDPKVVTLRKEFNTMEIARVYIKDEKGQPFSFDMTVESIGILDVPYIVRRACDVGEAMVGKYANVDSATTVLTDELVVLPTKSKIIGFDFFLRNHDHTLGNLLQTWLAENNMEPKQGSDAMKISYVGYEVPHPLRDEMVVRIGVESGKKSDALTAFAQACRGCAEMFRTMRAAWVKVNPSLATVTAPAATAAPAFAPATAGATATAVAGAGGKTVRLVRRTTPKATPANVTVTPA